jgi:ABC-type phosphate/phosphonate transport system substrate-binding protein
MSGIVSLVQGERGNTMPGGPLKNRVLTPSLVSLSGLFLVAGGATYLMAGSDASTHAGTPPLRLAVSENVVCGVNLNDARAAIAVWSEEILKTIDIKMAIALDQDWVMPSDQLLAGIRGGKVDLFCLTVQEYRKVAPFVDTSRVITDDYGGDELLLVVREGSGIVNLAGLRGRSLILLESPATSLATPWLTVSLWQDGLEPPKQLFGRMTTSTKLSQVVLPLFFGQTDACVVTRRGLDTMVELNPQLARKLKVLLASPKMEGTFFACRKDYPDQLKKTILDGLVGLKSSPPARQISMLFQSPGFSLRDADCLSPANSMLDAYERHYGPAAGRKR